MRGEATPLRGPLDAFHASVKECAAHEWRFPARDEVQFSNLHLKAELARSQAPYEANEAVKVLDRIDALLGRYNKEKDDQRLASLGTDTLELSGTPLPSVHELWSDGVDSMRSAANALSFTDFYASAYTRHREFEARLGDELPSPSGRPFRHSQVLSRSAHAAPAAFRLYVSADTREGPARRSVLPRKTSPTHGAGAPLRPAVSPLAATRSLGGVGGAGGSLGSPTSRSSLSRTLPSPLKASPQPTSRSPAKARPGSASSGRPTVGGADEDTELRNFFYSRGLRPPVTLLRGETRVEAVLSVDDVAAARHLKRAKQDIVDRLAAEQMNEKYRREMGESAEHAEAEARAQALAHERTGRSDSAGGASAGSEGGQVAPSRRAAFDLTAILDLKGFKPRLL